MCAEHSLTELPEHLDEAAMLTRQWAEQICRNGGQGEWSCQPYHRSWSTLRLMGAISGARTDKDFFLQKFSEIAKRTKHARVLIAGTADHAMLHMLLSAFRAEGGEPEVTVVDLCPTVLALNEWYAGQVGATINVHQADIRDIDRLVHAQDLITTHSVFSFFPILTVKDIFLAFKQSLGESGKLIFAQGIYPMLKTGQRIRFSAQAARSFQEHVAACFLKYGALPGLDEVAVRELADNFSCNKDIAAIAHSEDLLAPLAEAGFRVDFVREIRRSSDHYQSSASAENDFSLSLRLLASQAS